MPIHHLVIIGCMPPDRRSPLVEQVLSQWPESERPRTPYWSLEQVAQNPSVLADADLAWIILSQSDHPLCYEVIALLQDRQLAAMITRPGHPYPVGHLFQEGIIEGPPDASPLLLGTALRVLASQVETIRDLQSQLDLAQNQQHGLSGQINKMDEELRLAAQLQREFLPSRMPTVAGVEFGVLFRPTGYVSGDIYDVIRLDEQHVGIFQADAVGHGVPAALMTVYLKHALLTKEISRTDAGKYRIIPPSEALERLNRDMIDSQAGKVRTATAWYGLMNCQTLVLQYARAGHPYPMLLHADSGYRLLESEGGLLGVFPEETFELAAVQLKAGDRLLLYSDGFETAFQDDAPNPRQRKGLVNNRYFDEFRKLPTGDLKLALQSLEARLDQQSGSLNQLDDITAVCLNVNVPSKHDLPHAARQTEALISDEFSRI